MPITWEWQNKVDEIIRPYGRRRWHEAAREQMLAAIEGRENPVLLEAGCGTECWLTRSLKEACPSLNTIGIDIDPACLTNKDIDEPHVASITQMPVPDASVDLVVSGYVLEHLDDPASAFREMHRVLKPGGKLVAWTPNRLSPFTVVSLLTPHWVHEGIRGLIYGKAEAENARTFYRANTIGKLKEFAQTAGFTLDSCATYSSGYAYFRMSKPTYLAAAIANRLIMLLPLGFMKHTILAVMTKGKTQAP